MNHRHVPPFILRGKLWRIRFRLLPRPKLYGRTEVFSKGVVHTVRLGWLLVVAMTSTPCR